MLIYKSKLRFFGLRAPNQKPLLFKLLILWTDTNLSLSIASPDVVALVRKILIDKSKLRFFGLRAPNQKPLLFKLLILLTQTN